jgi:hypothetical protein
LARYIAASAALDQRDRVVAVLGIDADAEARRHRDAVRPDQRRRLQRLDHLLRDRGGVARLGELGEQDDELVAAVAADRVRLAHRRFEPPRRELQHLIADGVAERVVDLLEAVEVDEDHADPGRAAAGHRDRVLEPVEQQRARRRSGQLVVLRRAGELVEAADRGLRDAVGVHRRLHELGVDLEHLRGPEVAQLLLHLRQLAAQLRELGADYVGLGGQQLERAPCRVRPSVLETSLTAVGARARRARRKVDGGRHHGMIMPETVRTALHRSGGGGHGARNATYSWRLFRFLPCR